VHRIYIVKIGFLKTKRKLKGEKCLISDNEWQDAQLFKRDKMLNETNVTWTMPNKQEEEEE
jgi:hypothetical protein